MVNNPDRDELLAFVAEKYYRENFKQTEIADLIGKTRSAVSRMLSEARQKGLVEIIIHHPFQYDHQLEEELSRFFDLAHVSVVVVKNHLNDRQIKNQLGKAAARLLPAIIKPGHKIGISWGTSVQATIEAFEPTSVQKTQVIQLVGILGSTRHSYSAQILVEHFAQKIGAEGTYLYAPFIVENSSTAGSLMDDSAVEKAISIGEDSDVALMGIGTTKPEICSLLKGNHIPLEVLTSLQSANAVGDICGLYYDIDGSLVQSDFHRRRIGISLPGLKEIPTRIAVAGNTEKAEAILGAIRGKFINTLVTDSRTAERVLDLDANLAPRK